MSPFQSGRRAGYERRQEVQDFLDFADRRQGPRRFDEREAEGDIGVVQMMQLNRSVAERNPTLHPVFAGILQRCGA